MTGFLKMEGRDFAAFLIATVVGYVFGSMMQDPKVAVCTSIIFSYHLFLAWLVLQQSAKARLSMSIPVAVLTHVACMVVALGPVIVGNHKSPVFSVFRYGIAALALFERGWLFSNEESKPALEDGLAAEPALSIRPTAEDEIAWLEYLSKRRPGMTKPGTSVRQEHDAWLRARYEQRLREQVMTESQQQEQQRVTGESTVSRP
jgi:hypothetical protein